MSLPGAATEKPVDPAVAEAEKKKREDEQKSYNELNNYIAEYRAFLKQKFERVDAPEDEKKDNFSLSSAIEPPIWEEGSYKVKDEEKEEEEKKYNFTYHLDGKGGVTVSPPTTPENFHIAMKRMVDILAAQGANTITITHPGATIEHMTAREKAAFLETMYKQIDQSLTICANHKDANGEPHPLAMEWDDQIEKFVKLMGSHEIGMKSKEDRLRARRAQLAVHKTTHQLFSGLNNQGALDKQSKDLQADINKTKGKDEDQLKAEIYKDKTFTDPAKEVEFISQELGKAKKDLEDLNDKVVKLQEERKKLEEVVFNPEKYIPSPEDVQKHKKLLSKGHAFEASRFLKSLFGQDPDDASKSVPKKDADEAIIKQAMKLNEETRVVRDQFLETAKDKIKETERQVKVLEKQLEQLDTTITNKTDEIKKAKDALATDKAKVDIAKDEAALGKLKEEQQKAKQTVTELQGTMGSLRNDIQVVSENNKKVKLDELEKEAMEPIEKRKKKKAAEALRAKKDRGTPPGRVMY